VVRFRFTFFDAFGLATRTRSSLRDLNRFSHLSQRCRAGLTWAAPSGAGFSQGSFYPIIGRVIAQARLPRRLWLELANDLPDFVLLK
jgi:hypothetical protein